MAVRLATWLAIVVGGTGGTLAALAGTGSSPAANPAAPAASMPLRPIAQIAAQVQAAKPSATTVTPSTSALAPRPTSASAAASAPVAATATVASTAPLPAAELLPLPTTKEKLLRAEMHCDQRKAEDCIVAARSYETGSAGATDPEKATKYRMIALTAWISQCDHNSPGACATLAEMYRSGSGVPQSDKNADALVARARELCHYNDAPACHELPSP